VGIASASDPNRAAALFGATWWPALQPILLLAGTAVGIVLLLEIVQLRGLIFTAHPLKPDFSRINPAKGLKRLFSARMLKESAKNILKLGAYSVVTFLVIHSVVAGAGRAGRDAGGLAVSMQVGIMRLLMFYILLAVFFAALDQVIARKDYRKQMRMSRRELTREATEREGEPRLKQKRKQLHAEFAKERKGLGDISGSDLLVVNPQHIAVALAYRPGAAAAPRVAAKARNHYALAMKREALRLGIPIFENRPLARALYDETDKGAEIDARHYAAVADLYTKLRTSRAAQQPKTSS
ncbi:MAG TPA: EscU/YscU/HrcU family type III secretion system export apparatus switch protein, partial [Allosphingosinicella sp.]